MGRPPRNSIGSTASTTNTLSPLGSHALELDSGHRNWLARSLDKNDVELAALEKLNKSLHNLKRKILKRDGSEEKLLDAAACISKLENGLLFDEEVETLLDAVTVTVTVSKGDDLLKEFFLRMKLRRRILNRFARRLNRVSRSMDGETVGVGPPQPPKYGDVPVAIDLKKVGEFAQKRQKLEDYLQFKKYKSIKYKSTNEGKELKIEELTKEALQSENDDTTNQEEEKDMDVDMDQPESKDFIEFDTGYDLAMKQKQKALGNDTDNDPDAANTNKKDKDSDLPPDFEVIKNGAGIGATHRSMSNKEKIAEYKRWESDLLTRIPDQSTFKELGMNELFNEEERRKKLKEKLQLQLQLQTQNEENKIQDINNVSTSTSTSTLDKAEDSQQSQSSENGDDTEMDDTELDDSVSQPTKEDDTEMDDSISQEPTDNKEEDNTESNEKANNTNTDMNMKDKEIKTEKDVKEENINSDKYANQSKKDAEKLALKLKPKVYFSLQATPSFFNQDLRRARAVHAHLMDSTKKAHIQRLVTEATNEYNQAFRLSTELNNLRHKLQGDIARLLYTARSITHGKKKDYAVEVAIAKNKWQRRKEIWEQTQKKKLEMMNLVFSGHLKTRVIVEDVVTTLVDKVQCRVERRHYLDPMITMGNPIREVTASVIADMKDTIVTHVTAESFKYDPNEKFEDFIPPPDEDERPLAQMSLEYQVREAKIRNEINIIESKLAKSEEDRKRAWKRMVKVKAEAGGSRPTQALDHLLPPVPPLKGGKMYAPPPLSEFMAMTQPVMHRQMHIPSQLNVPTPTKDRSSEPSHAKSYSESIKARIFPDGSIKPVMTPKKLKDGTYQRPAGRKRKGMDWDAHRGVWTPSTSVEDRAQEDTY